MDVDAVTAIAGFILGRLSVGWLKKLNKWIETDTEGKERDGIS